MKIKILSAFFVFGFVVTSHCSGVDSRSSSGKSVEKITAGAGVSLSPSEGVGSLTLTVTGAPATLPLPGGASNYMINFSSGTNYNVPRSSANLASISLNGNQLFYSSGTNSLSGFVLCTSSAPTGQALAANSTAIVSPPIGFTQIWPLVVAEQRPLALVATDSIGIASVRMDNANFTVYNGDITNAKYFTWLAACK